MSAKDDGLTREQLRWLVLVAIAIGTLVALAIGGITAYSVLSGNGADAEDAPSAGFSVQTVDRDGDLAANVTHEGGEAVYPGSLVVQVDGESRGTWSELGGEGLDVVAPGHRLLLGNVTAGDTVVVVWIGDGAEETELGRGTVAAG